MKQEMCLNVEHSRKPLLISIIIPVYNVENYLPQCLDSVLAQTYKNLEILLIDDGSTDNSCQICDEYASKDSRIKVIHQPNQGVSAARNAGLQVAQGQYIGFVDADDYIDRDMFATLLDLCQMYSCKVSVCSVYNKPILQRGKKKLFHAFEALVVLHDQLYVCNKLFARDLIGDTIFHSDIHYCEDMLFCLEIFVKTSCIAYTSERKYYYRNNCTSATKKAFDLQKLNYFKSADLVKSIAQKYELPRFEYCVRAEEGANAASFLADLISYECSNKEQINAELFARVRQNIWPILYKHRSVGNTLFSIAVCVNIKLACSIYRILKIKK